jgi:hypothetical protein
MRALCFVLVWDEELMAVCFLIFAAYCMLYIKQHTPCQ